MKLFSLLFLCVTLASCAASYRAAREEPSIIVPLPQFGHALVLNQTR